MKTYYLLVKEGEGYDSEDIPLGLVSKDLSEDIEGIPGYYTAPISSKINLDDFKRIQELISQRKQRNGKHFYNISVDAFGVILEEDANKSVWEYVKPRDLMYRSLSKCSSVAQAVFKKKKYHDHLAKGFNERQWSGLVMSTMMPVVLFSGWYKNEQEALETVTIMRGQAAINEHLDKYSF